MKPWFMSLPLSAKAGYLLAAANLAAVVYMVFFGIAGGYTFNLEFTTQTTGLIPSLVLALVFLGTALDDRFRYVQPITGLAIGALVTLANPLDPSAIFFNLVSTTLLERYGLFRRNAWRRASCLTVGTLSIGVLAGILNPELGMKALSVPFETVVFLCIEAGFYWKELSPHFFPEAAPKFFIMEEAGLSEQEAWVLQRVLDPNQTLRAIAASRKPEKVSESTIKSELCRIYTKVGCSRTRAGLIDHLAGSIVVWSRAETVAYRSNQKPRPLTTKLA